MLAAINLDSEALLATYEIDNVIPHGTLSPKPAARELPHSEVTPQLLFGIRKILTE